MEVIQKTIQCSGRGDVFTLIPLYDVHLGTKNCDEGKFLETVKYIKHKKNCLWLGGGDAIEAINISDPRFDPDNISDKVILSDLARSQAESFCRIVKPIRDKCLGVLTGNHEEKVRLKYHFDPTAYITSNLKVPYLGYNCFITLNFKRSKNVSRNVVIFASHGKGGGGKIGASINSIMDVAGFFEADIYLMGHDHKKAVVDHDMLHAVNFHGGIPHTIARKRIFARCGTFLKTYEQGTMGYGETKVYSPTPTGVVKITIEPFRKDYVNNEEHEVAHIHASA